MHVDVLFLLLKKKEKKLQIITTMYTYHALITALSAHMVHINLNTIFYTHVKQSYQNNLHKVLYGKTHTQNRNEFEAL